MLILTNPIAGKAQLLQAQLAAPGHLDDGYTVAGELAFLLDQEVKRLKTLARNGVPHTAEEKSYIHHLCGALIQAFSVKEGEGEFFDETTPHATAAARRAGLVVVS